jgi:hypothetical protein
MSYQKHDPDVIHVPLFGSVADPAFLVRYSFQYKGARALCHGTRWTRFLLWLFKRAVLKEARKKEIHDDYAY